MKREKVKGAAKDVLLPKEISEPYDCILCIFNKLGLCLVSNVLGNKFSMSTLPVENLSARFPRR